MKICKSYVFKKYFDQERNFVFKIFRCSRFEYKNSNETVMSQREIYKTLVGKVIEFNDGIIATIVEWLPNNKNMYNELFKRYPSYQNVKDIKIINQIINVNLIELLKCSNTINIDEPDYMQRHEKNKIISFDTRRVTFFYGKKKYILDFSLAKMQDGKYIVYAKKYLEMIK